MQERLNYMKTQPELIGAVLDLKHSIVIAGSCNISDACERCPSTWVIKGCGKGQVPPAVLFPRSARFCRVKELISSFFTVAKAVFPQTESATSSGDIFWKSSSVFCVEQADKKKAIAKHAKARRITPLLLDTRPYYPFRFSVRKLLKKVSGR